MRALLGLSLLLTAAPAAWAQTSAPPARADASSAPAQRTRHERASRWFLRRVDALDSYLHNLFQTPQERHEATFERFLGYRGANDYQQQSVLRVSPGVTWKDTEGFNADIRLGAKLDLPRLENRLQLVVANFSEDENVLEEMRNQRFTRGPVEEESDGSVSLRLKLLESTRFSASADAGLSFRPEPVPKARLALRAERGEAPWRARASQTFFWNSDDGYGERSRLDLDHYNEQRIERLTTTLLWSETSEGLQLGESGGVLWRLSGRRVAGVKAGFSSHLEPVSKVDKYFVFGLYRSLIHRDYLFFEIEPGVEWPDARDWKETPFVNIQLDFLLGNTRED